jgi:transposase
MAADLALTTAPPWPASSTSYAPASPGGCCPPRQLGCGSPVTCWRRLRDWQYAGVWRRLHQQLLDELGRNSQLDWSRASLDSLSVRQTGGELTGPNPTDRGKPGSKYHLLVDRHGTPLAVALSTANTHDSVLLELVVDAVPPTKGPRGRPGRPRKRPAKLHGDKGYDYPRCRRALHRRGIMPRIARRGVESSQRLGRHRYVVERSLAWLVGYRRLQSATSAAPTSCSGSSCWRAR